MSKLPVPIDEKAAVEVIVGWIGLVAERMTSERGRQDLRNHIRDRLLRQEAIPRMQVIAAAEGGNVEADWALRELATEYISRREEMPTEVANYVQRALLRPPANRDQGRNVADTWERDIIIAIVVDLADFSWPEVALTRNRASKRPSICSLVSLALNKRGHPMGERQVERIYRERGKLVERLSASIPPI
jgi:hypothetical protein